MKFSTMKKIFLFALLFSGLAMFSCKKPEVIPAPTSNAGLKIHFQGIINGSDVEWTKNVDGYKAQSRKVYTPQTGTGLLDLAYYCGMVSSSKVSAIEIALGSLVQDPNLGTTPNMVTFKNFVESNMTPSYSKNATAGFEVTYTNENGLIFRSDETQPATVEFLDLEEKEDASGEYIQFKCKFTCPIFYIDSVDATNNLTGVIQNATLTGYFTR